MGRVIYETQVPAGHSAFRILAIPSLARCMSALKTKRPGTRIRRQHGVHAVPDCPGQVRYKVTMGRPQNWDHQLQVASSRAARHRGGLPMAGRLRRCVSR